VSAICVILGTVFFVGYIIPTAKRLQSESLLFWVVLVSDGLCFRSSSVQMEDKIIVVLLYLSYGNSFELSTLNAFALSTHISTLSRYVILAGPVINDNLVHRFLWLLHNTQHAQIYAGFIRTLLGWSIRLFVEEKTAMAQKQRCANDSWPRLPNLSSLERWHLI
jgi:hypothetical protein